VKPALDQVSGANIVRTITALQDIGTRYYQTQKGQEAAELIRREWEMLGSKRTDFSVALFPHGWIQNSVIGTIRGVSAPERNSRNRRASGLDQSTEPRERPRC
jgi:bacterial leucyl aminopeptidase